MDWLGTLRTLAPTVASVLGGPLAGIAVTAIGSIFGMSEPTQENIARVISDGQLTPAMLGELRKLDLQYQNDEKERGFKYSELEFKDRDSARTMQTATKSIMPAVLTVMITVGFFGILCWMMYDAEVVTNPPLLIMLGSLGTAWTGACAFWFGTTSNSHSKDLLLANSTQAG